MQNAANSPVDHDIEPILSALADGVPGHLNVEARCRLIQRITASVLRRAREHNLYKRDKNGQVFGFCPGSFDAEDLALEKLVATLSYTPAYTDFFNRNAAALGSAMAERIPAGKLRRDWRRWDFEKRVSFLQDIAEAQCRLFNHDDLKFSSPVIKVVPLPAMVRGRFDAGAWSLSDRAGSKKIIVSKDHLDYSDALAVAQTVWHEHTHSLCQQFAAARDSGRLPDYNPFARDAETSRQRLKYEAYAPSSLPRTYDADPEENLAFSTPRHFTATWEKNSGLLSRVAAGLRGLLP
ncbi:MAG: hypothetical protein HYU57_03725 [Micavibrio aeruginosavorus]|nr:hypothetical protein [Micavibrio aeruginosavorus]